MKVNRSCYYLYAGRQTFRQSRCATAVKECFFENRRRYGSRRIAASLKIGRATVQKVMRREGLRSIQPRSFKPQTTDSKHGLPVCANLLQDRTNTPTAKGARIRWRHHLFAAARWRFLLFGVSSGQVYAPHCRVERFAKYDGTVGN